MVQTILPIHGGNAIKLTTSLYYTPSDRSIQNSGITPDIELEFKYLEDSEEATQNTSVQTDTKKDDKSQTTEKKDYERDNQVVAALKYIKKQPK
jgi:carboxyl-terminal processing protease